MSPWSSMVRGFRSRFTPSGRRDRPSRLARQRQKALRSQRINRVGDSAWSKIPPDGGG